MALANYSDLQTAVASWLKRADLTANIPDLIALCEARISRDLRLRSQVEKVSLSANANTRAVDLPSDWLEVENVGLIKSPNGNLKYMNIEAIDTKYPENGYLGVPQYYSIEGSQLLLGPVPDINYTLDLLYYKRFSLVTTSTNWLMTYHPNIYLFGTLAEAAPFIMNDERIPLWEQKYQAGVKDLQDSDTNAQFSGSALRVRNL